MTNSSAIEKIAFGGGCYWCTEAVFQALRGVRLVEQGFIRSNGKHTTYSEAVIVHFDPAIIASDDLIAVHLHTHSSASEHSMRKKYRSAVYTFNDAQAEAANTSLQLHQQDFSDPLITQVLPFVDFTASEERYHNYYAKHSDNAFCQNYIHPKLQLIKERYQQHYRGIADKTNATGTYL